MKKQRLEKMTCCLGDFEVEVAYYFYPGTPGRWYMNNGDPGYPPEPPEIDLRAVCIDGIDIQEYLTDAALEKLVEQIEEADREMCEDCPDVD